MTMTLDGYPLGGRQPKCVVDFDGVLHRYSKGWHDGTIYDDPIEGAAAAMATLREHYEVVVYSCRLGPGAVSGTDQSFAVATWLRKHSIPYDTIWVKPGKPPAHLYIDDRGWHFSGDWPTMLSILRCNKLLPAAGRRPSDDPTPAACSDGLCRHAREATPPSTLPR